MPFTAEGALWRTLLSATTVPDSLLEFVATTCPGSRGGWAVMALDRPDVPEHLIDPLLRAACAHAPYPRRVMEVAATVALHRHRLGGEPHEVLAQALALAGQPLESMPEEAVESVQQGVVTELARRAGADHELIDALLDTTDRQVLTWATRTGEPEVTARALRRWDELLAAATPREKADAAAACEGLLANTHDPLVRGVRARVLAEMSCPGLVAAIVVGASPADPDLVDVVATTLVPAFFRGHLKGQANLRRMSRIGIIYEKWWTDRAAQIILTEAARPAKRSQTAEGIAGHLVAHAAQRAEVHARTRELGLPEGTPLALCGVGGEPKHAQAVADLLLGRILSQDWEQVRAVAQSQLDDVDVAHIAALLTAATA